MWAAEGLVRQVLQGSAAQPLRRDVDLASLPSQDSVQVG